MVLKVYRVQLATFTHKGLKTRAKPTLLTGAAVGEETQRAG